MRIEWAIPCRYVEINGGLATIVGAVIEATWAPTFPQPVGLMMAIRLVAAEGDTDEHRIANHILGPDMEPLAPPIEGTFRMGEMNPLKPPGWEQTLIVPAEVRFVAGEPGVYTIVTSVDDRTHSVPVMIGHVNDLSDT